MHAIKVLPGNYYVTPDNEMLMTVLGSCISACIRDVRAGIGGMNHFMLPVQDSRNHGPEDAWNRSARYGNYAMELLINAILKRGGERKNLEVKVFGGGRILRHMQDIGERNITFVREYIRTEGLVLAAEDVGGEHPRKILYFPGTGKVRVRHLRPISNTAVARKELSYRNQLEKSTFAGEVVLFED
jgi:chemotaxis protein CheD